MHRLQTSYAGYFNRVHEHTGALFGTRFKSEPVETDEYLMTVVRYIHENPVKAHIAEGLRYPWSSFREYEGNPLHINPDFVLDVFGGRRQLLAFHDLEHDEGKCMDYLEPQEKWLSDDCALAIAEDELGKDVLLTVKGMSREKRNAAIVALRKRGLGVRQIQRLTGVSLGGISRAVTTIELT